MLTGRIEKLLFAGRVSVCRNAWDIRRVAAIVSVVADELTGRGSVEYPAGSPAFNLRRIYVSPEGAGYIRRFFVGECR